MSPDVNARKVVIACQGGGSHAAYAAGALKRWLPLIEKSQGRDALALRGISGTSGGALCALLAWYGQLQGGAAMACHKLEAFWQSNCAQTPGERLWNDSAIAATASLPFEVSFSPYTWPLRQGLTALTSTWPALAGALGPFNAWGRAGYFELGPLIDQQVDFALIEALGGLLGIANDIQRWREADLQCGLQPPLDQVRNETLKRQLAERIQKNARDQPAAIAKRMKSEGFGAASPLEMAMSNWPEGLDDPAPFEALDAAVKEVRAKVPHLLIGAVDVRNGEFVAFSSERARTDGGISLQAVMASAALPWIFEAVPVEYVAPDGTSTPRYFWDGLFSQNPPVKNFLAGEDSNRIPDEIWVLQVNPRDYDVPLLEVGTADRRNELAGNLSLNQEISFIEAVNKRVTRSGDAGHRRVQVHRIILDRGAVEQAARIKLDALSKTDRSPVLKDALMAHGELQGQRFLRMRGAAELACDRLDGRSLDEAGEERPEASGTLAVLSTIREPSGDDSVHLHIDETILPSSAAADFATIHATARWHARGILADGGAGVQIEGESDFIVSDDSESIVVSEVRITQVKIEQQAETAALAMAARLADSQAAQA